MSIKGIFPIEKWNFKSASVLSVLSQEDLELLMAHRLEQTYKKGEPIFREGAFPQGIFYIAEGKVKKFKVDASGREQIFYVSNTGELIGYHSLLAEDRYPDSASALEASRITFIPKEDFLEVLGRSDALSRRLLKTLSHEFAVLTNGLSLLTQKSVRERLALQLVVLREKYKTDATAGSLPAINMSREDLANLVGSTQENVVRLLSTWKQEGLIETQGRKIIVLDVAALVKIADYR